MPYYTLFYTVPYCIVPRHTVVYRTVICTIGLYRAVLHRTVPLFLEQSWSQDGVVFLALPALALLEGRPYRLEPGLGYG